MSEAQDEAMFRILRPSAGPRLGTLTTPSRKPINTPDFITLTSRGAWPHITPDHISHVPCSGSHFALEDFLERKDPPILNAPATLPLHTFTGLPRDVTTFLTARRTPAVPTPKGNDNKTLSIYTSHGFRTIDLAQWSSAVQSLSPDIVVPLADLPHTVQHPSSKRLWRMVERTEEWMDDLLARTDGVRLFAPILPVEFPVQWQYLRYLSEEVREKLAGLTIYDVDMLPELSEHEALNPLPRLSFDPPSTPHQVLRQISLGADILTIPFLNSISDAGVALTFTFPPPSTTSPLPLGMDMWSPSHAASLAPLVEGCTCYACANHHRAFVQHLLNAKEMLGWTLLQLHNYHIMGQFFAGVRKTLELGVEAFEEARGLFLERYEDELPRGTGQRPRVRGYQLKSEGGDNQINQKPWKTLGPTDVLLAAEEAKRTEGIVESPVG